MTLSDQGFQFALLGATLIGSIIAVLLGRLFDKGSKRGAIVGVWVEQKADVIDFTHMGFLLQPKGGAPGLERVFQRSCIIRNIGFEIVYDFEIVLESDYGAAFDPTIDFGDFRLETEPSGLNVDISDVGRTDSKTQVSYKFKFLNRGDYLKITYISSRDVKVSFMAHHPGTEIIAVSLPDLIPTIRQKIGSLVSKGRVVEIVAMTLAVAGVSASISQ